MKTKYPIYIISKGRYDCCLTEKSLVEMNVPHRVVIEPCELDLYKKNIDKSKLLVLPFENLGRGSIPARNWVMEHSIKEGHERHWILDDNIRYFYRLNENKKIKVKSGITFKCIEDFVNRYKNIKMAGMNYQYFCIANNKCPPYYLNTRIYSCILLSNDINFRWRGRYNEDTDLSLRILKAGYCTVLFNTFICGKISTQIMKGGNTDHVYIDGDKRYKFAKSLQEQHPDVTKVVWRYDRWHHDVDYSKFSKNKLVFKDNYIPKSGINNYGMKLVEKKDGNS